LNEQISEKRFVEKVLYPSYSSYTDVYDRDGLLDCEPILAHCVHMSPEEFDVAAAHPCAIAHCPTSNTLLGSGVMPLDQVAQRNLPYSICTDVGASPTVSLLAEMSQYLKVHATSALRAVPSEALWRTTLGAAQILHIDHNFGTFSLGRPLSYVEIEPSAPITGSADETIQLSLLDLSEQELSAYQQGPRADAVEQLRRTGLDQGPTLADLEADTRRTCDQLAAKVTRVVVAGQELFRRSTDCA
jgi:guanine deaminase